MKQRITYLLIVCSLSAVAQNTERFHTKDNLPYFPVLTNAPTVASAGAIYINSTDSCAYRYSGNGWIPCRVGSVVPAAKQVAITTNVVATGEVTGTYIFIPDDAFALPESGSSCQWYEASDSIGTDSTAIPGATEISYTVNIAAGRYLAFSVTPKNSKNITGIKTFSNWQKVAAPDTAYDGTKVVDLISPSGQIWMDRNLGASRAATGSTDYKVYGSLFQWCRAPDGHEKISWTSSTSGTPVNGTTSTLSVTIAPSHSKFIINSSSFRDWLSIQETDGRLWWNGSSVGVNNPCPAGYHVPTYTEWNAELSNFSAAGGKNATGAWQLLKLLMVGYRYSGNGSLFNTGSLGRYWSSTGNGSNACALYFDSGNALLGSYYRAYGRSVRCIKYQLTDNDRPKAENVNINGTDFIVGNTVTGTYSYTADVATSSAEGTSTYQWYYATDAQGSDITIINGATDTSYTIDFPVISGTYLAFGVTPVAANGIKGKEVLSSWKKIRQFAYDGTEVINITSTSGRTWMDRNLGASRSATSSTDYKAYGSLFQWCRAPDGHEKINWTGAEAGTPVNGITGTISSTTTPAHSLFIIASDSPKDWLTPQLSNGNLWWNGSSVGANNPCPAGYHVPTETEWSNEEAIISNNGNNAAAAFALLKLPLAGYRYYSNGSLGSNGSNGYYWSSSVNGGGARDLGFHSSSASLSSHYRTDGFSVRCIKNECEGF